MVTLMRTKPGATQRALKQTKPFRSPAEALAASLLRTADLVRGELEDALAELDVTGQQYNVLRILRGAGPDGHACSEIGARLVTRDPDVTRLLDRLEKRGLVVRSREHADRRVVTTRVTEAGLAVLAQIDEPLHQAVQELLGHLSRPTLETLLRTLDEARDTNRRSAARSDRRPDAGST